MKGEAIELPFLFCLQPEKAHHLSDSGIIGSKDFVSEVFDGVKHLLDSKNQRRFTPFGEWRGGYSMKRLVDAGGW
ncbi:hypothetical protein JCM31598_25580 [Desulfonatronum parangueonense]